MASAWGTSWGSAWGDSWGSIDSSGVGAPSERARVNLLGPADKIDDTLQPRLFDMIEQLLNGQSRNASTVTLDTGETSTTVDDPLVESQHICFVRHGRFFHDHTCQRFGRRSVRLRVCRVMLCR
jgi:hypothetical protein